jgi:hypothetical protein
VRYPQIISLLFLGITTASSAEKAGMVLSTTGHVTAENGQKQIRPLSRRSDFNEDDTLKTGNNSTAELKFKDGTTMALASNTILKIQDYKFKGSTAVRTNVANLALDQGSIRTVTGVIAKENPDAYQLKTPIATIGVRGTIQDISFGEDGLKANCPLGESYILTAAGVEVDFGDFSDATGMILESAESDPLPEDDVSVDGVEELDDVLSEEDINDALADIDFLEENPDYDALDLEGEALDDLEAEAEEEEEPESDEENLEEDLTEQSDDGTSSITDETDASEAEEENEITEEEETSDEENA